MIPVSHGDVHLPNGSIPPNPPIFHGKNRNEVMKFITMFLANACRATEVEVQRWHSTLPHLVFQKKHIFSRHEDRWKGWKMAMWRLKPFCAHWFLHDKINNHHKNYYISLWRIRLTFICSLILGGGTTGGKIHLQPRSQDHLNHDKKTRILCMKHWLFNREPYSATASTNRVLWF